MKKTRYNVAVVGATGAVGREMISILAERDFPVGELRLLASEKSRGETLEFKGERHPIGVLGSSFQGIDLALFSAGGAISQRFAPIAAQAGAVVIDNSSAFRMDPEVPLVVPEVNPEVLEKYTQRRIVANPNCSTIQLVAVLKPIHDRARIRRVVVSTYQSTAGAGQKAMDELSDQVRALFNQQPVVKKVFPHQIAFNCIPHIDVFGDNDYTKEEMKIINETQKILADDSIRVTATAVRVPVFCGHSEAVNIETEKKLTPEEARSLLRGAPGVVVKDDPKKNDYPLALDAAGKDGIFVGRIREDATVAHGLNLWIVSDNLRKGAALNAVQIAELLINKYL